MKGKTRYPQPNLFRPVADADRRIVATLQEAGYTVALDYLKRSGTRRRLLAAYPRCIVREGESTW